MKKSSLLLGAACVLAFSAVAFAEVPDGQKITTDGPILIDQSPYYKDNTAPRNITADEMLVGDQTANLKLRAEALIPCYVSMKIQGNDENVTLESFGKGSVVTRDTSADASANYIGFYPSVGGFVNGDWSTVADSSSAIAEVKPGTGKYIRGCDTFKTQVYSNLDYHYSVNVSDGGNLKMVGGTATDILPVGMRVAKYLVADKAFSAVAPTDWTAASFDAATGKAAIVDGLATQTWTVFHQFRVPYLETTKAGTYKGSITFTATTL